VRVTPIDVPRMPEPFFLVSLHGATEPARAAESSEPLDLDAVSRDRLEALELELRHTKENLQATIEELEASNEELQATNEELLASNEELQSTNEELHSVNEELYTVNAEYQRKIDQLVELTDDMDNLLLSTEVHTLFLDENLCVRKFTPAIAETFNLVAADVGRRIDGFAHGLVLDGLTELLARTIQTGERFEQEVVTRSGTAYLMRVVPYLGRGHRSGVVLTLIDISKLRAVELALREQVLSRDRFLAMLSHELRNPLAAVNNALSLLERRGVERTALREPMTMIARQSRHMQRLLDDLLDVARVTQGKIRLRDETFDLREVASELVEQVGPAVAEHRHALAVEQGDAPLWIRGDRARMLQVLDNLLTNAIKYTPDGGHVALRVARVGDRARVTVVDDGVGIDPATRRRIFEMFVQADATLDRSQGGLGVGLTLVRHLVGLHGGEIEVRSEGVGRGATFEVTLPLSEPPAAVAEPVAPPAEASEERSAKLVVVEDRLEIRETLAELLRDDGFVVITADNGTDGLQVVERERPGAALLDIGLPGVDGFELARRLRSNPATSGIRLVALTGYGTDEDKVKVKAAGFDAHIVKPFHIDEVLAALGRLGLSAPHRLPLPAS
jgi:two-component system CheB/CheR fusion protein